MYRLSVCVLPTIVCSIGAPEWDDGHESTSLLQVQASWAVNTARASGRRQLAVRHWERQPDDYQGLDEHGKHPQVGSDDPLHWKLHTVKHNNLCGAGPDTDGPEGIRYGGITNLAGDDVDLMVNCRSAAIAYKAYDISKNGLHGDFGNINLDHHTNVSLRFHFLSAATDEPVKMPYFHLTFFDMDEGPNGCHEYLSVGGMRSWDLIEGSRVTFHKLEGDRMQFRSSVHQSAQNNPFDTQALSPLQAQHATDLGFPEGTEGFDMDYEVTTGEHAGRNLLFAGVTTVSSCRRQRLGLDFESAELLYSNLGRQGPDFNRPEGMRFNNILQYNGRALDLIVNTASEDYKPQLNSRNGKEGKVGQINLPDASTVDLEFSLVDAVTSKLASVPNVLFSVFDIDQGRGGNLTESLTMGGYTTSYMADLSELRVDLLPDHRKVFLSSTHGVYEDNAVDPMQLTPLQKIRSVTYLFHAASQWTLSFSSGKGPASGRNFRFGGKSELVFC